MISRLDPPKRRFPWIRLAVGAYFPVAAIVALLRTITAKQAANPYFKVAALSILVAGAVLLASGIWIVIDRRDQEHAPAPIGSGEQNEVNDQNQLQ